MLTYTCDQWDTKLVNNIDELGSITIDCNLKDMIKTINVLENPFHSFIHK